MPLPAPWRPSDTGPSLQSPCKDQSAKIQPWTGHELQCKIWTILLFVNMLCSALAVDACSYITSSILGLPTLFCETYYMRDMPRGRETQYCRIISRGDKRSCHTDTAIRTLELRVQTTGKYDVDKTKSLLVSSWAQSANIPMFHHIFVYSL